MTQLSPFREHRAIKDRIDAEFERLGFDEQMRVDLTCIVTGRVNRLTLRQLKALLIELQGMDEAGDRLHPDSPLAKWLANKTKEYRL